MKELPEVLAEPYYYLSKLQAQKCKTLPQLRPYIAHLPCWVPHKRIADALGFNYDGIYNAIDWLKSKSSSSSAVYVWATEFENVHSLWRFWEPEIIKNNERFTGSEDYYQRQKYKVPRLPSGRFDSEEWNKRRDDAMRDAVKLKFCGAGLDRVQLRELLLSTKSHPLLSVKNDWYWGVKPTGEGENMLARLLMDLREELRKLP